jgi:D-sedoheptulose 7-phosphate isomerase
MNNNAKDTIAIYLEDLKTVLSRLPVKDIKNIVKIIVRARDDGKRIYIFGNGGSSATASHMVCDFAKGSIRPGKKRIKAFALTDNTPMVTAWANDSAYENIFSEQLENYIEPGDVAIAISGSGNSANVLKGIAVAKTKGAVTIGLTGFKGGKLKGMVDYAIIVPSDSMEQIEDVHMILDHIIRTCLHQAADC